MKRRQHALPRVFLIFHAGLCLHAGTSFYLPQQRIGRPSRQLQTPAAQNHSGGNTCITTTDEITNIKIIEVIDNILEDNMLDPSHVLDSINQAHETDLSWARSSPIPFEKRGNGGISGDEMICNPIEYESIGVEDSRRMLKIKNLHERPIAIRTKESTPLMSLKEIQLLKSATESYWNHQSSKSSSSRFTYQRKGNSEAHFSDVVTFSRDYLDSRVGNDVTALVNELVLHRIYPWIREAFPSNEKEEDAEETSLYIYDSLFIRYNATEANINDQSGIAGQPKKLCVGAGQPLHRDLGYVSVNIMLNDPCEFQGGGTFFENQLLPALDGEIQLDADLHLHIFCPLKPIGAGHALAHFSSSRHAGAATIEGVRDILVIFIAVTETTQSGVNQPQTNGLQHVRAPRLEVAARLKTTARSYCQKCILEGGTVNNAKDELLCRILHLRLAIGAVPDDGEAWHYLGMALTEYANIKNDSTSQALGDTSVLDLAIACLEEATKYTPCDARLHNNIGLAWEKKLAQSGNYLDENDMSSIHGKIKNAYEKAVLLNSIALGIGCDVRSDYERACLNFGLYLSYQNNFREAVDVLERIGVASGLAAIDLEGMSPDRQRVIDDARRLLLFCKKQLV